MELAKFSVRSALTLPAAGDADVLALAYAQIRVVLTEDTDFGELAVRFNLQTHGVVRVALKPLVVAQQVDRLIGALDDLGSQVYGALVTIEPRRTRLRKLVVE